MVPPSKKQNVDERIVYFDDQVLLEDQATLEEQNQNKLVMMTEDYCN